MNSFTLSEGDNNISYVQYTMYIIDITVSEIDTSGAAVNVLDKAYHIF